MEDGSKTQGATSDEIRDWFASMMDGHNPSSSLDRRLQTQREEFIVLKKDQEDIKGQLNDLGAAVQALIVEFKESRKVNYPMLVLLFSLIPFAGGGSLYFISGQIDKAVAPITSNISQLQTNQTAHDKQITDINIKDNTQDRLISNQETQLASLIAEQKTSADTLQRLSEATSHSSASEAASQADRVQINMRIQSLEQQEAKVVADRASARAEVSARLVEIEQQFHAMSNISNIQMANQNRINSMLWEKTHPGERYPERDFFPSTIYQTSPAPLGASGRQGS